MFSDIGQIIKVRLVSDMETGKPRGFAFVEFADAPNALAAIRHMNGKELNGRSIRVNFSNNSHLENLAKQLGMDAGQPRQTQQPASQAQAAVSPGTTLVADALKALSKAEMYDIVAEFKERADKDPDEARRLLASHPQLPEAMLFLMSKLDMIKKDVQTQDTVPGVMDQVPGAPLALPAPPSAPPTRAADPRARMMDPRAAAAAAVASDPRAAAAAAPPPAVPPPPRSDPRARMDPRAARSGATPSMAVPPPPPSQQHLAAVPPPYPPPPPYGAPPPAPPAATLTPDVIAQVMNLTEDQIAGLPFEKQQQLRTLRAQLQATHPR